MKKQRIIINKYKYKIKNIKIYRVIINNNCIIIKLMKIRNKIQMKFQSKKKILTNSILYNNHKKTSLFKKIKI